MQDVAADVGVNLGIDLLMKSETDGERDTPPNIKSLTDAWMKLIILLLLLTLMI